VLEAFLWFLSFFLGEVKWNVCSWSEVKREASGTHYAFPHHCTHCTRPSWEFPGGCVDLPGGKSNASTLADHLAPGCCCMTPKPPSIPIPTHQTHQPPPKNAKDTTQQRSPHLIACLPLRFVQLLLENYRTYSHPPLLICALATETSYLDYVVRLPTSSSASPANSASPFHHASASSPRR